MQWSRRPFIPAARARQAARTAGLPCLPRHEDDRLALLGCFDTYLQVRCCCCCHARTISILMCVALLSVVCCVWGRLVPVLWWGFVCVCVCARALVGWLLLLSSSSSFAYRCVSLQRHAGARDVSEEAHHCPPLTVWPSTTSQPASQPAFTPRACLLFLLLVVVFTLDHYVERCFLSALLCPCAQSGDCCAALLHHLHSPLLLPLAGVYCTGNAVDAQSAEAHVLGVWALAHFVCRRSAALLLRLCCCFPICCRPAAVMIIMLMPMLLMMKMLLMLMLLMLLLPPPLLLLLLRLLPSMMMIVVMMMITMMA
jgi:hypothetical protein